MDRGFRRREIEDDKRQDQRGKTWQGGPEEQTGPAGQGRPLAPDAQAVRDQAAMMTQQAQMEQHEREVMTADGPQGSHPQGSQPPGKPDIGAMLDRQKGIEVEEPASRMTPERVHKAYDTLNRYRSGKAHLESRLVEVEQWWKLRHWEWMQEKGASDVMRTASGWLFNVIISKHADGIQSIPEAAILPREEGDRDTAKKLQSIIPCVLEENGWEEIYSDVLWQKLKGGTGAYGVFWDADKLNGLGDISIRRVDLLRLYWEPGISDIQESRNVFYIEPVDVELLKQQYPDKLKDEPVTGRAFQTRKFITEDPVRDEGKAYVVDWYYHQYRNGKKILSYCKLVDDIVLYCTEDTELDERGLYDHAEYPFVLDRLFPVEGSPCGFGYIDVCKGAQEQIDILNQAVVQNALVNAVPRYFMRADGSVNEEEFLDFTKAMVHVTGTLSQDSLVPITPTSLNGNVINLIQNKIAELKETSGNTDSSNGVTQSGAQAASAIAALQEASGKVSKAVTYSAYRAFQRIITQVIELIRQFYELPRQYRILGEMGDEQYISFDNRMMQPQPQGIDFGVDMGYRLPVYDVKVQAQTRTSFNRNSKNELALSLYQNGLMNPQLADQALMVLDMMDFDDKDRLMQRVAQNQQLMQQMAMYQQIALQLAQQYDPMLAERLAAQIMGGAAPQAGAAEIPQAGTGKDGSMTHIGGKGGGAGGAITKLNNARERAQEARSVT